MRLVITKDVAKWTSIYLLDKLSKYFCDSSNMFYLGLPTGSTAIPLYNRLVDLYQSGLVDFSKIVTFNMDEYVGIEPQDPNSYHYFMYHYLFNHVNINKQNIHIPNGLASDIRAECQRYDDLLKVEGGIDLWLAGIGTNGHIAFNEPYSSLFSHTRDKELDIQTRLDNARFFDNDLDKVPKAAITVGIQNLLDAKEVLVMSSGINKAHAISHVVEGSISHVIPLSILQLHKHCILVVDDDSASELKVRTYRYFKDLDDHLSWVETQVLKDLK